MLNCRPGDLAISVNTELPENEGTIVRVVRAHVNEPAWDFGNVPTWWCGPSGRAIRVTSTRWGTTSPRRGIW
jgi:hypothetical protein